MFRVALLLIALTLPEIAVAAPVRLHDAHLVPYKNEWRLTIQQGPKKVNVGVWTDEVVPIKSSGRALMARIQVMKIRKTGGTQTWVNTFDAHTFEPIGSALYDTHGNVTLRKFDRGAVHIIDASGDHIGNPQSTSTKAASIPIYDFDAGMYGLLFLGLPLHAGLAGTMATYGPADATVEHIAYNVVRSEKIIIHGASENVWVIDCHYLDAHRPEGDAQMRFWLSAKPPYIINLNYDVPSTKTYWRYRIR